MKFKSRIKNLKFILIPLHCCFCFFVLWGCATVIEGGKTIAGLSTKALEDNRKYAEVKSFNCDYDTCYNEVEGFLIRLGTHIYARDAERGMIAVYVSEEDTTPVGLFLKEIDAQNTQIEVSSPSTYAKEFISERVFSVLEKSYGKK